MLRNTIYVLLSAVSVKGVKVTNYSTSPSSQSVNTISNDTIAGTLLDQMRAKALTNGNNGQSIVGNRVNDTGLVTTSGMVGAMGENLKNKFLNNTKDLNGSVSCATDVNCTASKIIPAQRIDTIAETRIEYDQHEDAKFHAN